MDGIRIKETAVRLIRLRTKILDEYPFFGRLLMRLPFGFAPCGTACTDMKRIIFDPAFASSLDDAQLSFVILHELMHCVLKHCTRSKGKLRYSYNVACDIVVNSVIMEALGISDMKIGGSSLMHLTPKGREGRFHSAEEVYAMLLERGDEQRQNPNANPLFDDHGIWETLSDGEFIETVWDAYMKGAARAAGNGSGIPTSVARLIDSIAHKPKIDWRQILHDYIQFANSDYVFSPPDRRYSGDFILPSFQPFVSGSKIDNVWFVIDTSGSVSSFAIAEAFEEIKDAIDQIDNVEGYVSFFDTEVSEALPFGSVNDIEKMTAVGGGGTSFEAIFNFLAFRMKNNLPKVMIIITDGYSDFPDESAALGVPVIWLIIDSNVNPPFGEVIHIQSGVD